MTNARAKPFDSIESAHEFLVLLEESIAEALEEVEGELEHAKQARMERQVEALALAVYKMNQLTTHVRKSRRIMKDLRVIHRLLETSGLALAASAAD